MNGGSGGSAAIREGGAGTGLDLATSELGHQLGHRLRLHADRQFPHRSEYPGHLLRHQDHDVLPELRQPEPRIVQRSDHRRFRLPGAHRFAHNRTLPGAAGCTSNLLPTTCAPFQEAVQGLSNNPSSGVDPQAKTLIFWINDGGYVQ